MDQKKFGDWLTLEELGSGGQGIVYRAIRAGSEGQFHNNVIEYVREIAAVGLRKHPRDSAESLFTLFQQRLQRGLGEFAALKVLHEPQNRGEEYEKARARMRSEIKAFASVNHPNLARVIDHDESCEWIAFEYYENKTLSDHIEAFKGDARRALEAFQGLVEATAALHDLDCIHRDIKPANIFLGSDGSLILGDLGLIYFRDDQRTRVTAPGEKVGTRDWMPTWAQGDIRLEDIGPSFDIFSLGKLLWSMLAGKQFLRLHYFDQDEFDLRNQFPRDMHVRLIHEQLLSRCIVEFEDQCLSSAGAILEQIQVLMKRIDAEDSRQCKVCGRGKYIGDAGCSTGSPPFTTLFCDSCGHILHFIPGGVSKLPDWADILKDDHDGLK